MPSITTRQIGGRRIPAKIPIQKAAETSAHNLYLRRILLTSFNSYTALYEKNKNVLLNFIGYLKEHIRQRSYRLLQFRLTAQERALKFYRKAPLHFL